MSFQKQISVLFAIFFSIFSSIAQVLSPFKSVSDSTKSNYSFANGVSITDSIVNFGKMFLKTPYQYGSSGADSFDCSGFTSFVYRNFGYNLHHSSAKQAEQFDTVKRSQIKSGDLVYFSGNRRKSRVGHVGIVVAAKENGEFDFIHAAIRGGVIISNSKEQYYTNRFVKANRVISFITKMTAYANGAITQEKSSEKDFPTPLSNSMTQTQKTIQTEYHSVKSGETLISIALIYGISVAELKKTNNLKNNKIICNQKLKLKTQESILLHEPKNESAIKTSEVISKTSKSVTEKIENPIIIPILNSHTVKKGESLFSIAKIYNVSIDDLKKFNNLKTGRIQTGQDIKISQPTVSADNRETTKTGDIAKTDVHKVMKGESLYTISKKYNVSIDELKKINKLEKGNIQTGQELKLSQPTELISKSEISKTEDITKSKMHKVTKGETLFSISKKYNVSVDDLMKYNNLESSNIHYGQSLVISQSTTETNNIKKNSTEPKSETIHHKVKAGESYYSLAHKYNCTVNEIKEWNNKTGSKLNIGDKITIQLKTGK